MSASAAEQPVLMVIDDAHWVDDASADALLFAARRLEGEPVALLLALRPVEGRRLDLAGVEQLAVGGLARAEAAELLRDVPPEVVERLHAATAGNPLALLEAPAHLPGEQLSGRDPLGDPLPVGPGVQAGFRRRLERLPPRTRTALLLAAAAGTEPLIAGGLAYRWVPLADLEPAEADQLVEVTAGEVRFRHPLVRAAAYQDAPAPERRAAHRALAEHTFGARRANHLWAAAAGPDPVVAAALDEAAAEARARTGFSAAARGFARAGELYTDDDERGAGDARGGRRGHDRRRPAAGVRARRGGRAGSRPTRCCSPTCARWRRAPRCASATRCAPARRSCARPSASRRSTRVRAGHASCSSRRSRT